MTERPTPQILIEPWAAGDLDLLHRLNAPEMKEHLGGPETEEQVLDRHRRYLTMEEPGAGQMFAIVLLPDRQAVGSIGYWEREWHGETVYETGWGVLPPFQGRGIAVAATRAVIAAAAAQRRHKHLHAYPSSENPPSNAICRKAGFTLVAECDFEYPPGNIMRCNDWCLELNTA